MRTIGRNGIITLSVVAALLVLGGTCVATYNKLIRLDQAAAAQWAQVENTYQRRADLVPNLVETVGPPAASERETTPGVTRARTRVGEGGKNAAASPAEFKKYQEAQ